MKKDFNLLRTFLVLAQNAIQGLTGSRRKETDEGMGIEQTQDYDYNYYAMFSKFCSSCSNHCDNVCTFDLFPLSEEEFQDCKQGCVESCQEDCEVIEKLRGDQEEKHVEAETGDRISEGRF